jgi:acetyltransferase-like isoleucine patch superfamily enzyme
MRMKRFTENVIRAILLWGYYRIGWLRAGLLGVRTDWRARVSPRARISGAHALGCVEIGGNVTIGRGSYLSSGLVQCARIGRYCSVGPGVLIGPSEHRLTHWTTSPCEAEDAGESAETTREPPNPTVIGDGVWIGAHAVLLQGVRIGDRAVIAAGAVVVRDVPAGELWAGVPARRIKAVTAEAASELRAEACI